MNTTTQKRLARLEEKLLPNDDYSQFPAVVVVEQDDGTLATAPGGEAFANTDEIRSRYPGKLIVVYTVVDGRRRPAEGEHNV